VFGGWLACCVARNVGDGIGRLDAGAGDQGTGKARQLNERTRNLRCR